VAENLRALAAVALAEVVHRGRSLSTVLEQARFRPRGASDRAFLHELCYGVLRWYLRLQAIADRLLSKPLKAKDSDIQCLILVGLYQQCYLRVPAHAAVAETVNATQALGKPWAKGLVNALLRRFQREQDRLLEQCDSAEAAALAHPPWLLEALKQAWPERWRGLVAANNRRPPMVLRVNARQVDREGYLQRLAQRDMSARPAPLTRYGVIVNQPVDVNGLPGFAEGWVSVQDSAAQLSAELLDLRPGLRVLDACAAPGGKTGLILETEPGLAELVALDSDIRRLERLQDNLRRLRLTARAVLGDVAEPAGWWDTQPFDRILLDVPCSATGVIRRHPDIKVLRKAEDVPRLVEYQACLLAALWGLLKPRGLLVYVTCSVLPQENSQQMLRFLAERRDASVRPIEAPWGVPCIPTGRQILTGDMDMDGFYYACLSKT
jgi:16S rRNA (cytosine967-C5)-methyltransferase